METETVKISKKEFQKMLFLMNVLDKGWSVKKIDESYIFTKKHEGKKEIFQSDYLDKFIESNLDISNFRDAHITC
jgi:hypothetical protein